MALPDVLWMVEPGTVIACGAVRKAYVMPISASEARRNLSQLIGRINEDHDAVEIVSRRGNAVLMPADEYAAWQETAYLFRSPANARRLLDAYERARSGQTEVHELDRED